MNYNLDNIQKGVLPNKVICAIVDQTAFAGDFAQNPFKFMNHGLKSIILNVGGTYLTLKS